MIIATKSISGQFDDIKKEVKAMMKELTREVSKEAVSDLKKVHRQIMDDFYGKYTPHGKFKYVRTKNLYHNSIIPQDPIQHDITSDAGIVVGSFMMHDNYNISPDNVFDLMWNKGVRGLPKVGTKPLANGEVWHNPTWISKYGERENVFKTSITLGGYSTKTGTPHQVMAEITNHWKEANGENICSEIGKKIKDKYK